MIKYRNCTADPVKLQQYDVLEKVQGFSGPVVQGRIYYDAFVLDAKKAGIGVCKTTAADFQNKGPCAGPFPLSRER